jgi:hypothetical protein
LPETPVLWFTHVWAGLLPGKVRLQKICRKKMPICRKKNELLNRYIRQLQQQLRAALKRQNTPSKTEKKAKTVKPAARGKR